jgi:hypothetical protein
MVFAAGVLLAPREKLFTFAIAFLLISPFCLVPTVRSVSLLGSQITCSLGTGELIGWRRGLGNWIGGRADFEALVAFEAGRATLLRVQDVPVALFPAGFPPRVSETTKRSLLRVNDIFRRVSLLPGGVFLGVTLYREISDGTFPIWSVACSTGLLAVRAASLATYALAAETEHGRGVRWFLRF